MKTPRRFSRATAFAGWLLTVAANFLGAQSTIPPPSAAAVSPPGLKDAQGRTLRRAPTGHITNYDEGKVAPYQLPELLVLADGTPVPDAETWLHRRRPEILCSYETEIFGRVPKTAPRVTFALIEKGVLALDGIALRRHVVAQFGEAPRGPRVNLIIYRPAHVTGPVPLVLHVSFGGDPLVAPPLPAAAAGGAATRRSNDLGPVAEILARGFAYGVVRYSEIQPDNAAGRTEGVMGLALGPGQTTPLPDEWEPLPSGRGP